MFGLSSKGRPGGEHLYHQMQDMWEGILALNTFLFLQLNHPEPIH